MESLYWVLSRDCNQRCRHCYNDSEPGGPGLTKDEVDACVAHLPRPHEAPIERIILSGGEPLAWPELLFHALERLQPLGSPLWLQTNGDFVDAAMLDDLLRRGVVRIDVASVDGFHSDKSRRRLPLVEQLLREAGMRPVDEGGERVFAFWGATEGTWIAPIWPRGRAQARGVSRATPSDHFCSRWSGAKGFLDVHAKGSEVNVQLSDVYPCCPMTNGALGDLRQTPLLEILDQYRGSPVFEALNAGSPVHAAVALGMSEADAEARVTALGNECLFCDELFATHKLLQPARTPRASLVQIRR